MTSYFRRWLSTGGTSSVDNNDVPTLEISPPPSDDEDLEQHDDTPPAFPSLASAQRASPSSGIPAILTDAQLMPPPPAPHLATRQPGVATPKSSLSVPTTVPSKKKGKVALAPGHGTLDWANLKESGADLRGVDTLMRIPPSVLKTHSKRNDAWTAINSKVYNITPYLSYHPGGEKELMRVAGRDGTKLFTLTHSWVNVEFMLDACLVGFLIPEPSS